MTTAKESKFLVFVHNVESGAVINQFVTVAKTAEAAIENCVAHIDDLTQDAVALPAGKVHGSDESEDESKGGK